MKFGRLNDISEVDFKLKEDHFFTKKVWDKRERPPKKDFSIHYGCPSWGCPDWKGKIYPEKCSPKDYLKYYSQAFNAIELNTTFYQIPQKSTVENWKKNASPGFIFCPKVSRSISHSSNAHLKNNLVKLFFDSVSLFEDKLGHTFIQFPEYFNTSYFSDLKRLVEFFPQGFPLAVELRHESWFEEDTVFWELCEWLFLKNISLVITDVSGRRDVLHQALTSDTAFIRFTGNSLHKTDYSRVVDWIGRISLWKEQGLEKVYFFIHQPGEVLCPELTEFFIDELDKRIGCKITNSISSSYKQKSLFE